MMRPRRHRVNYEDEQEILKGKPIQEQKPKSAPASLQQKPLIQFQQEVSYVFELSVPTEHKKVQLVKVPLEPSQKQTKTAFKKKKKYSVSEWDGEDLGTFIIT